VKKDPNEKEKEKEKEAADALLYLEKAIEIGTINWRSAFAVTSRYAQSLLSKSVTVLSEAYKV
jgi:hypothetical protein